MVLFDTNIVIEVLKGNQRAIDLLERIGPHNIAISSVTQMELFFGALDKRELAKIRKHISFLSVLQINEEISRIAVELIGKYVKSHSLKIPDALIAATALCHTLELCTYDTRDFDYIEGIRLHGRSNSSG
jgi:tRNA(fMet)-specific endonuclease VapC